MNSLLKALMFAIALAAFFWGTVLAFLFQDGNLYWIGCGVALVFVFLALPDSGGK